jgi:hypothetical protein
MLQLRLEVVASEDIQQLCIQAVRIATANGIEVVLELDGKDVIAKPGMNPESLLNEVLKEPAKPKGTGKKGGKEKEATVTSPQDGVSEETI